MRYEWLSDYKYIRCNERHLADDNQWRRCLACVAIWKEIVRKKKKTKCSRHNGRAVEKLIVVVVWSTLKWKTQVHNRMHSIESKMEKMREKKRPAHRWWSKEIGQGHKPQRKQGKVKLLLCFLSRDQKSSCMQRVHNVCDTAVRTRTTCTFRDNEVRTTTNGNKQTKKHHIHVTMNYTILRSP